MVSDSPDGLFAIMVKEGTTETMYYVPHAGADLQSVPIKYVWQFLWQLSSKHLT
jgi:hypothetical protein